MINIINKHNRFCVSKSGNVRFRCVTQFNAFPQTLKKNHGYFFAKYVVTVLLKKYIAIVYCT